MSELSTTSIIALSISAIAIIIGIYIVYSQNRRTDSSPQDLKKIIISIKSKEFELQVADTGESRETGLMHVTEMADNKGMLFVFPTSSIYPFWMMNTYIPLDIIWLNSDKEIVYIARDSKPCGNVAKSLCKSIIPTKAAKYIIELNSGLADKLDLKVGDKIDIKL